MIHDVESEACQVESGYDQASPWVARPIIGGFAWELGNLAGKYSAISH
jgi:hypothetical protein